MISRNGGTDRNKINADAWLRLKGHLDFNNRRDRLLVAGAAVTRTHASDVGIIRTLRR